jgi:hypothetical protein
MTNVSAASAGSRAASPSPSSSTSTFAQHDVQPVTIEKLRWLLSKAVVVFGDCRIGELTSQEISEWRMNLSRGFALLPERRHQDGGDDPQPAGLSRQTNLCHRPTASAR